MYASLMISLLAAFVAMLGKQWSNRYLRNYGGSVIERCGDRQRKCDGLEKWPFHSFVESLPLMLQAALLLLACGLCRHMWSINALVARTLISLTGLGVTFYIGIVIAGMSSYACPFQTPASIALHGLWKKVRGRIAIMWSHRIRRRIVSSIAHSKRALTRIHKLWNRGVRPLLHRQSLPAIPLEDVQVQQSEPVSIPDSPSQSESPLAPNNVQSELWLKPKELDIICRTNTSDARCVSWILRNITDPEALDAALPVAGEIRWFDYGVDVDLPYDVIVSTFEGCFDSTRTLYPGSRDRAYYSGRAMAWIRTLAMCKSEELASRFHLPIQDYTTPVPDPDLKHLLYAIRGDWDSSYYYMEWLLRIDPGHTHPHSQWISNLLLHYSWTLNQTKLNNHYLLDCFSRTHENRTAIPLPLNTTLNRFLVWCTFLGSSVEEEALRVQLKSYGVSCFCFSNHSLLFTSDRMEPILDQLSKAVLSSINGTDAQHKFIPYVLDDLIKLETRPQLLTRMTYEWCSMICENRESFEDWERPLLVCLEIGFRHLDFRTESIEAWLAHTEHHRGLVDVVFKTQGSEVIADLLHAWTTRNASYEYEVELLGSCAGHLVGLYHLGPFSLRLRRLVIRSVQYIGYKGFEGVGVERLIELLNHLHVTTEDMDSESRWAELFLETFQTPEGAQRLSDQYLELLVELKISFPWILRPPPAYNPQITTFITEAQEWSKLEYWIGIVWMTWPPGAGGETEEGLDDSTLLLFRQRPEAVQKLEKWMERRYRTHDNIPQPFKRICTQAHEAAQRDAP